MRSLDTEGPPSKPLACGACRVESKTRRSGGMADAADSKFISGDFFRCFWFQRKPRTVKGLRQNSVLGLVRGFLVFSATVYTTVERSGLRSSHGTTVIPSHNQPVSDRRPNRRGR